MYSGDVGDLCQHETMRGYDETWEMLTSLYTNVFRSGSRIPHEADGTLPTWFVELLTKVHFMVGNANIRYASSSVRVDGDERPDGQVVVFTDDRVIRGSVTGDGVSVVSAWPRTTLQQADLIELDAYPQRDFFKAEGWPPQVEMRLLYPAGELILPLGKPDRRSTSQFLDFVEELGRDLTGD